MPQIKLILSDEHQRQRYLIQNGVYVLLNHLPSGLILQPDLHSFQCATQSLGTHECLSLLQNNVEVKLEDLSDVLLLEIVDKRVQLKLIRIRAAHRLLRVSIFNQQNSISNNESLLVYIAYFAKSL